jgi:large subunit ribosomal protein L25
MNLKVEAQKRTTKKKSDLKQLRNEGQIPAIIYGQGRDGILISIDDADFFKIYRKSIGEVAFFDINVDGENYTTVIREKQVHPLSRKLVHIDFMELQQGKPITIDIPVQLKGEAEGVKKGGVLEFLVRNIQVTCLPKDVPDAVEIDVTNFDMGDSIHVADLEFDYDKVDVNLSPETTILTIAEPSELVIETEEAEGEELAEGEEIAEGEETTEEGSEEKETQE